MRHAFLCVAVILVTVAAVSPDDKVCSEASDSSTACVQSGAGAAMMQLKAVDFSAEARAIASENLEADAEDEEEDQEDSDGEEMAVEGEDEDEADDEELEEEEQMLEEDAAAVQRRRRRRRARKSRGGKGGARRRRRRRGARRRSDKLSSIKPHPTPIVHPRPPTPIVDPIHPGRPSPPTPIVDPMHEPPTPVVDPFHPTPIVDPRPPTQVVDPMLEPPTPIVDPFHPEPIVDPRPPTPVVDPMPEPPTPVVDPFHPKPIVDPRPPTPVVDPIHPGKPPTPVDPRRPTPNVDPMLEPPTPVVDPLHPTPIVDPLPPKPVVDPMPEQPTPVVDPFHPTPIVDPRPPTPVVDPVLKPPTAIVHSLQKTTSTGCPKQKKSALKHPLQCDDPTEKRAVRCCSDSGEKVPMKTYGCHADATYEVAHNICFSNGLHLCKASELDQTCGTGCGYDHHRVWTSDNCGSPQPIVDPTPAVNPQPIPIVNPILGGDDGALCANSKPFGKCVLKPSVSAAQPPATGICLPDMEEAVLRCSPDDQRSLATDAKIKRFEACDSKKPGDACSVSSSNGICKTELSHYRPQVSAGITMKRALAILMCEFPQVSDPIDGNWKRPILQPEDVTKTQPEVQPQPQVSVPRPQPQVSDPIDGSWKRPIQPGVGNLTRPMPVPQPEVQPEVLPNATATTQ